MVYELHAIPGDGDCMWTAVQTAAGLPPGAGYRTKVMRRAVYNWYMEGAAMPWPLREDDMVPAGSSAGEDHLTPMNRWHMLEMHVCDDLSKRRACSLEAHAALRQTLVPRSWGSNWQLAALADIYRLDIGVYAPCRSRPGDVALLFFMRPTQKPGGGDLKEINLYLDGGHYSLVSFRPAPPPSAGFTAPRTR
jgi:hypothetical protein